jgi:SAM-dependent methyltransferase
MPDEVLRGGDRFRYASVARRYGARPAYPSALFDALADLLPASPRTVLDVGCGPGKVALGLLSLLTRLTRQTRQTRQEDLERIDAVDPSPAMLEEARAAAGPRDRVRWIQGRFEEAPLDPPYGLVTAGASFHWLDAEVALGRVREILAPGGWLAVLDGDAPEDAPWSARESELHIRFLGRMEHGPAFTRGGRYRRPCADDPVLDHPGFRRHGRRVFRHDASCRVEEYVAALHSRQSFVLEAMGDALAREFDAALCRLLEPHAKAGMLRFTVATRLEWGRPAV